MNEYTNILPLPFLGSSSFWGVGFAAGFAGAAPPFGVKKDLISGMICPWLNTQSPETVKKERWIIEAVMRYHPPKLKDKS
jgi:hypothetical protein